MEEIKNPEQFIFCNTLYCHHVNEANRDLICFKCAGNTFFETNYSKYDEISSKLGLDGNFYNNLDKIDVYLLDYAKLMIPSYKDTMSRFLDWNLNYMARYGVIVNRQNNMKIDGLFINVSSSNSYGNTEFKEDAYHYPNAKYGQYDRKYHPPYCYYNAHDKLNFVPSFACDAICKLLDRIASSQDEWTTADKEIILNHMKNGQKYFAQLGIL